MTRLSGTAAERLEQRLVDQPNGCREFSGYRDKVSGYGRIGVESGSTLTHRVAWESANGPVPEGFEVCHHCDNPPCCQTEPTKGYPEGHLFLGTHAENMADMIAKGRKGDSGYSSRPCCPQGHPYDEANTHVRPNGWRNCRACDREHKRVPAVMKASALRSAARRARIKAAR